MTRVEEIKPEEIEEGAAVFKYIIMQLPMEKMSEEKLKEMDQKTGIIKSSFKTQIASEEKIPALKDLYNTCFFQAPDPYRPVTIDDMKEIYERCTIIIGRLYGMDVGFIVLKLEQSKNDDGGTDKVGVVCGIAVHPRHRQKGIATALGIAAYDFLSKRNLDYLECEVFEENEPSLSFITWVGFRPVGELIVKAPSVEDVNPLERI